MNELLTAQELKYNIERPEKKIKMTMEKYKYFIQKKVVSHLQHIINQMIKEKVYTYTYNWNNEIDFMYINSSIYTELPDELKEIPQSVLHTMCEEKFKDYLKSICEQQDYTYTFKITVDNMCELTITV